MKQRYTISVTGPVWVDYSVAMDVTCVSDAINHLESLDPEIAAQWLICLLYTSPSPRDS